MQRAFDSTAARALACASLLALAPAAWAQPAAAQPSAAPATPAASAQPVDEQQLQQAREMIGRELYTPRNYELGTIDDVVRDPHDGKLKAVIAAGGGFLGVGQSRILMPLEAIELTSRKRLREEAREREGEAPPPAATDAAAAAEQQEPRRLVAVTRSDMTKEAMQQFAKYTPEGGFEPIPLFEDEPRQTAAGSSQSAPRG